MKFRNDSFVTLGQYYSKLVEYEELEESSGVRVAGKYIYDNLNRTDKFKARSDFDFWKNNHIQEYRQVFQYGLDDVERGLKGAFPMAMRAHSPNPRLGYSTATNSDGSVVLFGSPTDSLGKSERSGFYFLHQDGEYLSESGDPTFPRNLWASKVNSGAVRIFTKGKDFEPISSKKVLEYNRFGNLSNTLNNTEGFDEEGNETNSTAISNNDNYDKTDFGVTEIPADVGSIFIITPEIDAANDEVIGAIKDWMSLGDRRLILVGDDPVWEKDGAYAESNRIINKVLEKLDSKMRLHPAKNRREALLQHTSCSGEEIAPNVIESYTPVGSNSTNVKTDERLFGYGVADIRLHVPDAIFKEDNWGKGHNVVNNRRYGNCMPNKGSYCGPPIAHNGDLRARWIEKELKHPLDPQADDPYTYWERNLPFEFYSNGTPQVKPSDAVDIARDLSLGGQGEQPRPLMVAAEYSENFGIIPAIPEKTVIIPITETTCYETNSSYTYYEFSDQHLDEVVFSWGQDSGNPNFVNTNIGDNVSEGVFYNPTAFNDRDGVLQADGTLDINISVNELIELFQVDRGAVYCAKEKYNDSQVYMIAGTFSETEPALRNGEDENISFYDNLVRNANCDNAFILQLGGWTQRNSFAEAADGSLLDRVFRVMGHDLVEGWDGPIIPASKDVVWIANPAQDPEDTDIQKIKNWLSLGNKKLVITYDKDEEQSAIAYRLSEKLDLGMKPWYLPGANVFPVTATKYISMLPGIVYDREDQSIASCNGEFRVESVTGIGTYCPIDTRLGGRRIITRGANIRDERLAVTEEYQEIWNMNTGVAKVQFPAIPGSGYRIFYNWIADKPEEKQDMTMYLGDVLHRHKPSIRAQNPATLEVNGGRAIRDYDENRDLKVVDYASTRPIKLPSASFGNAVSNDYVDVQVPHDKDYINLFLTGNKENVNAPNNQIPRTFKFLSVSGAPLPISEKTVFNTNEICETVEIGFREEVIQEYVPPSTVLLPATVKPIMNDNTKYCLDGGGSCSGRLVADGPVVIAEEPETFSDGATGNSRSKILLISDSTIVNGCLGDIGIGEENPVSGIPTVPRNTMLARVNSFLDSLTTTETTLVGTKTELNRGYELSEKIVSPERGSPAIYSLIDPLMSEKFSGAVPSGGSSYINSLSEIGDEANFEEGKLVDDIHSALKERDKKVMEEMAPVGSRFNFNGFIDPPLSGDPFSDLQVATGKDLLDYNFDSGTYPGDLFGHDVDIHNGKIIVGSPYSAFIGNDIINISGIETISQLGNAIEIGKQGGGGSAYVFEKTVQFGWKATKKLKPDSVRSFDNSDRFGWSIAMDADFAAVSAPGHDFGNIVDYQKGAFVRKEFNAEFDIGTRTVTSIGSGESQQSNNTGAVFTFENKLYDWSNRAKDWVFAEKIIPQGYKSDENTHSFGNSVAIERFSRTDSDYVMAVGSHRHTYGVDNTYNQLSEAGSVYTYDAMLRNQPPSTFSEEAWLDASVFGLNRELDEVNIFINQFGKFESGEQIISKGLIYSDDKGQIFMEASGQDPRDLGFIVQRPYIERIEGEIVHGTPVEDSLVMTSYTDPFLISNSANLYIQSQESDIVYNNLEMSTFCAYLENASGLSMMVQADEPTSLDVSGMTLHTTASGISESALNMRIRGK